MACFRPNLARSCALVLGIGLPAGALAQAQPVTPPTALASTPAGTGAPQYNLSLPMFAAGTANPYDLSATTTSPATPPPAGSNSPPVLPDNYTFDSFRQNIHGYVSAGVATHNGHEFSGGVEMPLVPGKVDLAFGANTGQIGGFAPLVPGGKTGTANYNSYYGAVHLHPADNVDAYIGFTGGRLSAPSVLVP